MLTELRTPSPAPDSQFPLSRPRVDQSPHHWFFPRRPLLCAPYIRSSRGWTVVIPTTAGPEPDLATLSSLETYFGQLANIPAELVVATVSSSAPYTYTITLKATSSSKASSHLTAVNGPNGVETASKAAQVLNSAIGSTTFAVAETPTRSVGPIGEPPPAPSPSPSFPGVVARAREVPRVLGNDPRRAAGDHEHLPSRWSGGVQMLSSGFLGQRCFAARGWGGRTSLLPTSWQDCAKRWGSNRGVSAVGVKIKWGRAGRHGVPYPQGTGQYWCRCP